MLTVTLHERAWIDDGRDGAPERDAPSGAHDSQDRLRLDPHGAQPLVAALRGFFRSELDDEPIHRRHRRDRPTVSEARKGEQTVDVGGPIARFEENDWGVAH